MQWRLILFVWVACCSFQMSRVAMYARQNLALTLTDHEQYEAALVS